MILLNSGIASPFLRGKVTTFVLRRIANLGNILLQCCLSPNELWTWIWWLELSSHFGDLKTVSKCRSKGDHKILFVFDNKEDVDRILASEPWSFDKSLVVLQRYDWNSRIEELSLDKTSFCVRVHNIPIRYRNRSVVEDICESIKEIHHLLERFTAQQRTQRAKVAVLYGWGLLSMFINLFVVAELFSLRREEKHG